MVAAADVEQSQQSRLFMVEHALDILEPGTHHRRSVSVTRIVYASCVVEWLYLFAKQGS